jgi:hypothetical protein
LRGRSIPLSLGRRLIADLVHAAGYTTKGVISRQMSLAPLMAARTAQTAPTPWSALVTCAFARVARDMPELRRSYVMLPWPQLYEVPVSIAAITTERELDGEKLLFFARIRAPDALGPVATGEELRRLMATPLRDIPDMRKLLRITAMPLPLRRLLWWIGLNIGRQKPNFFGTFAFTSLASRGATICYPVQPVTTCLSMSPINPDGSVDMIVSFDHRVFDGAVVARALAALEAELNGPVAEALRG